MKRIAIFAILFIGALLGIFWWFNVEQTGGNFADFFTDPVDGVKSLGSRFWLWMAGQVERFKSDTGISPADPRALAASLIAGFEGFSSKPYADPPGQTVSHSIGYGHKIVAGDGYDLNSEITEADGLAQLNADLDTAVSCVDNGVQVDVAPEQKAALYSLAYNIGCGAFGSSTLLRVLNQGNYDGAAAQFSVWNKSNGVVLNALVSRRADEQNLFQSVPYPGVQDTDSSDTEDETA